MSNTPQSVPLPSWISTGVEPGASRSTWSSVGDVLLDRWRRVGGRVIFQAALSILGCALVMVGLLMPGAVFQTEQFPDGEKQLLVVDAAESADVLGRTLGSTASTQEIEKNIDNTIIIYVSGAVANPGVYTVSTGDRLGDAISQAGGFHLEADTVWLHRELNLAARLTDGQKIYVPFSAQDGESAGMETMGTGTDSEMSRVGETAPTDGNSSALISINSATLDQLDSLPGIGSKRAEDIIAGRPYTNLQELVERKIISSTVFEDIKLLISL